MRNLVWFSAGAASAVALKMSVEKYGQENVLPVYCDTGSEHPDNARFIAAVETWLGVKVQTLKSAQFQNVDDVIEKTRFMRGLHGARCTTELKKIPRLKFQEPDDRHIFGYTYEEGNRIAQIMSDNWDLRIECPLYSAKIKKQQCLEMIHAAGIELPIMYRLGFNNNNCIGCVKAEGPDYWLLVKKYFPDVFWKRAKQERELGFALCRWRKKPVFLDELKPHMKSSRDQKKGLNCDFLCTTDREEGA